MFHGSDTVDTCLRPFRGELLKSPGVVGRAAKEDFDGPAYVLKASSDPWALAPAAADHAADGGDIQLNYLMLSSS